MLFEKNLESEPENFTYKNVQTLTCLITFLLFDPENDTLICGIVRVAEVH